MENKKNPGYSSVREEDMFYEYWLASLKPLSARKKRMLRDAYGSARAVYYIEETRLDQEIHLTDQDRRVLQAGRDSRNQEEFLRGLKESWEKLKESGIRLILYEDPAYPSRLSRIPDPPYAIYVRGELPPENQPAVAIVGARKCTPYGEEMALEYAETLAGAGVAVISGMARGIDGAGHRGALNAGGKTYGVLGCGVDVCYPREHIGLYMDILKNGGLIAERAPGEPPLPAYFPERNRIISGLSDVILIMEAKEKSGSLITADQALEQGKDVYALPGPADSALSQGCHRLIRQGAGILLSPEDLLEELGIDRIHLLKKSDRNKKMLESPEHMVYSCLGLFPKSTGTIIEETGFSPQKVMEALVSLVLEGYAREVSKNHYVRAGKSSGEKA